VTDGDKIRENRLRRMARRQRLALQKSRRRDPNAWDYETYQLVDPSTNGLVYADFTTRFGYGLSLDDVEAFLSQSSGPASG